MTLHEVNTEIKTLEKEDTERNSRLYSLRNTRTIMMQKECEKNVGRCFKHDCSGNISYIKIINAPPIKYAMYGANTINEYQYPALYIMPYNRLNSFEFRDLFSGAWGHGNNCHGEEYTEITKEEFNEVFERVCNQWKQNISEI